MACLCKSGHALAAVNCSFLVPLEFTGTYAWPFYLIVSNFSRNAPKPENMNHCTRAIKTENGSWEGNCFVSDMDP